MVINISEGNEFAAIYDRFYSEQNNEKRLKGALTTILTITCWLSTMLQYRFDLPEVKRDLMYYICIQPAKQIAK